MVCCFFLNWKLDHFSKQYTILLNITKIVRNSLTFQVFCVIFPDFSLTAKFLPIFQGFPVWVGTLLMLHHTSQLLGGSQYTIITNGI